MSNIQLNGNEFERFTISEDRLDFIFDIPTTLGIHTQVEITPAFDAGGIKTDLFVNVLEDGEQLGNRVNIERFGEFRDIAFTIPILGGFSASGFNVIASEDGAFLGDVDLRVSAPSGSSGDFEIRIIDTDDAGISTDFPSFLNISTSNQTSSSGVTQSRIDFANDGNNASDIDLFLFGVEDGQRYNFSISSSEDVNFRANLSDSSGQVVRSSSFNSDADFDFLFESGGFGLLAITADGAADYTIETSTTSSKDIGDGISISDAKTIALIYEAALNRNGDIDSEGLNFWIDVNERGLSIEDIADHFLVSDEFVRSFGDINILSDRDLVEVLYRNVLDREGEQAGVDFWASVASDPAFSDANLLVAFAESSENRENSLFVETLTEPSPGFWGFFG